jgi:hypothetical protein
VPAFPRAQAAEKGSRLGKSVAQSAATGHRGTETRSGEVKTDDADGANEIGDAKGKDQRRQVRREFANAVNEELYVAGSPRLRR